MRQPSLSFWFCLADYSENGLSGILESFPLNISKKKVVLLWRTAFISWCPLVFGKKGSASTFSEGSLALFMINSLPGHLCLNEILAKNVQLLWPEFGAGYALSRHMDGYALDRVKDCDFGAKGTERWGQDRVLASIVAVFYISRSADKNLFVPNTVVAVFMVVYLCGGQS